MKNLFGETPLRLLAFGGLLLALFLAFLAVRILLVPFVAALFVVYLFDPAITAFQRRGVERGKAFLILLGTTLIAIAVVSMFMPQWLRLESIGGSSATFTDRLTVQVDELERWVDKKFPMFRDVEIAIEIEIACEGETFGVLCHLH